MNRRAAESFALVTSMAVTTWVAFLLIHSPIQATLPVQNGNIGVEITESTCFFNLDYDFDGIGERKYDPDGNEIAPQESLMIGECYFQFNTVVDATIEFHSELEDWTADVELRKEPGVFSDKRTIHAGRTRVPVKSGGMAVELTLRGRTPRGADRELFSQGYEHDVQITRRFRLLEIAIITHANDTARVYSKDIESASNSYIEVHQRILAIDTADVDTQASDQVSRPFLDIAKKWLTRGYPNVAQEFIELEVPANATGHMRINWWKWAFVVLVGITLIGVAVAGTTWYLQRRSQQREVRRPTNL